MKRLVWMVAGVAAVAALAGVTASAGAGAKGKADPGRAGLVTLTGKLQVKVRDFENQSSTSYVLRQKAVEGKRSRVLDLVLPKEFEDIPLGSLIEVSGTLADDTLVVTGAPKVLPQDEAANERRRPGDVAGSHAANVTEHHLLVILAQLSNLTQPCNDPAPVYDDVFGASDSVKEFYWEQSFHQLDLQGDVVGPYPLAAGGPQCRPNTWIRQADEAAEDHGVNLGLYDTIAYVFPEIPGEYYCTGAFGGEGQLLLFGACYDHGFAHELGHALGVVNHAQATPGSPGCYYCDHSSTMGDMLAVDNLKHFNSVHKINLGWIPNGPAPAEDRVLEVTTSGLYTVTLLEADIAGTHQVLKFDGLLNGQGAYYVSYRTDYGMFGPEVSTAYRPKMNVHKWIGGWSSTWFLGSDANNTQAHADGQTWAAPDNDVCITMVNHTSTEARIWVSFDCLAVPPPSCPNVSPCNGMSCLQGSETGTSNTGYAQCVTAQGTLLSCSGGQTVKVVSNNCTKAPCCTATPYPCFCPQTCPSGTRLECR